jgi:DNA-binding transcriptional ArsR family regulator
MLSKRKQLLFEKQAEIAKAIAHPLRIAVVNFLKDSERGACRL